jgi:hypothetical protein
LIVGIQITPLKRQQAHCRRSDRRPEEASPNPATFAGAPDHHVAAATQQTVSTDEVRAFTGYLLVGDDGALAMWSGAPTKPIDGEHASG